MSRAQQAPSFLLAKAACLHMSVNASPSVAAAPTAPSRAAKAAVTASGEAFGAMVADAVGETGTNLGDKPVNQTPEASADTSVSKADPALSESDSVRDDTSDDAATLGLLTGAALVVVQPQQQPVPEDAAGIGAIDTDGAAKAGVDLLQTASNEAPHATDASKAAAQPTAAATTATPTTAAETAELFAAALNEGAPQSSDLELTADTAMQAEVVKDGATLPATQSSTAAAAQIIAPRLAASAFGAGASNAAAGSAKVEGENRDQSAQASDPANKGAAQASTGSSLAETSTAPTSTTQPQTAATSAFAAQMQAQAQSQAAESGATSTTDTLPTGQSLPTQQAASTATAPVVTSFSSLSRATLDTTVQIAAQITRQLAGRSTRFEMGLTPEGLGKVNVSMDIDADGQLTARLAFDNPLAAADLRARADELRTQLQDAGFKLAHDALTFSQQDASTFSDGGAADQQSERSQNRAFASASRLAADADAIPPVPAWVSLSLTPRGVDMKV